MRSSSLPLGLALTLSLTSAGCVPSSPVGLSEEEIALPGDWDAPPTTRAIAATQDVDVVEPPAVLPLGSCTSTNPWEGTCTHPACLRAHPGTTALDAYIRGRWTYVRAGGTFTCRRNSNPDASDRLSVHSVGRAIDLMIPLDHSQADNTLGDPVANWLIENAEFVGIQRVIWDGWYWNGERGFSQISDTRRSDGSYRTDHHTNHIHVELSVDGAAMRTRFFTDGAPPDTCPNVCYGTAVVQTDCSYVDCAVSGEVCLDGPPRCGSGAPPEPLLSILDEAAPAPRVGIVGGLTRFTSVPPARVFDTREGADSTRLVRTDGVTSGPLTATRRGYVEDWPGLPAGATSVWMNLAALPRGTPGFIGVEPFGSVARTSVVNFAPPRLRANAAIGNLAGTGLVFIASTEVDLIADITGAFTETGRGLRTYGPRRLLDTRATATPLASGVAFSLDVEAPADATGVVASVAVVGATADGFLVAYPCASPVPETSNINFAAGRVSATTVISDLSDGRVCFWSNQPADLIVDVTGYLVPDGELSFQGMFGTRLLDTRTPGTRYSGRLGVHQVIELPVEALAGMPPEVRGVVVNLVSISPGSRGYLSAFPCGAPIPGTSSLNFDSDDPAAALVVSAVGPSAAAGPGSLCIFASARTDVVVDLVGVWVPTPAAPPPVPGPGPVSPDRPEVMEPTTVPPPPEDLMDAGPAVYEDSAVVFLPDGRVLTADDFDDTGASVGPRTDGATPSSRRDTGTGTGAGGGPGAGGCGCRVGQRHDASSAMWSASVIGAAVWRRRRRRAP